MYSILKLLIALVQGLTTLLARNASRLLRLIGNFFWAALATLGILYIFSALFEVLTLLKNLPTISEILRFIIYGALAFVLLAIVAGIWETIRSFSSWDMVEWVQSIIQPGEVAAGKPAVGAFIILSVVIIAVVGGVVAGNPSYEFETWIFQKTQQALQEVKTLAGEATTVALKREPPKVTTTGNIPPERTRPEPARLNITGPTCSLDADGDVLYTEEVEKRLITNGCAVVQLNFTHKGAVVVLDKGSPCSARGERTELTVVVAPAFIKFVGGEWEKLATGGHYLKESFASDMFGLKGSGTGVIQISCSSTRTRPEPTVRREERREPKAGGIRKWHVLDDFQNKNVRGWSREIIIEGCTFGGRAHVTVKQNPYYYKNIDRTPQNAQYTFQYSTRKGVTKENRGDTVFDNSRYTKLQDLMKRNGKFYLTFYGVTPVIHAWCVASR